MTTTTSQELINEAFGFFRAAYVRELTARLTEKAEDGEVNRVVKNDMIDGDLLTGVDETAYSETRSEYGWRVGTEELHEAFQEKAETLYDGIEWGVIIATAAKAAK